MHKVWVRERIEDWEFARCRCGFVMATTPAGKVWWLLAGRPAKLITSPSNQKFAMLTRCRLNPIERKRQAVAPVDRAPASAPAPLPRCKHGLLERTCGLCREVGALKK